MDKINIFQKAIELLILEGNSILQVKNGDEYLYFAVLKWQENYSNQMESINFNSVEGVNITEFLLKNSLLYRNKTEFLNKFMDIMADNAVLRCNFSKESEWFYWSIIK